MNNDVAKLLADFVQTAKEDSYNLDVTITKFPELQQVDKKLLADFVQTAKEDGLDLNVTLPKFPEFTGEDRQDSEQPGKTVAPEIFKGTPLAGVDAPTSSGEEGVDESSLEEERLKKEEEDIKYENYKKKFDRDMRGSVSALGGLTEQQKIDLFGENHIMQSEEWKIGILNSKRESGEWDGMVGGSATSPGMRIEDIEAGIATELEYEEKHPDLTEEEIETKRQEDLRAQTLDWDDEIDLNNLKTVVDKDADLVAQRFDKAPQFPGLNVTDISNLPGWTNAVRFELPDGTSVEVNLRPREKNRWTELSKLQEVEQWYEDRQDPKHKDYAKMKTSGLFRMLGEREDDSSAALAGIFGEDKLRRINQSLSEIDYEIQEAGDKGDWTSRGYKIVDKKTGEVKTQFIQSVLGGKTTLANDVQAWLWNNLDSEQLNTLSESSSALAVSLIKKQRELNNISFDSEINSPEKVAKDLKSSKDYATNVEKAIKMSEGISSADKQVLVDFINSNVSYPLLKTNEFGGQYWHKVGMPLNIKIAAINKAAEEGISLQDALSAMSTDTASYNNMTYSGYRASFTPSSFQNAESVYEGLIKILAPGETFNSIITEEVVTKERRNRSSKSAQEQLGLWQTKVDQNGVYKIEVDGKEVEYNPEAAAAAIDNFKANPEYAQILATRTATKDDPKYDENGTPTNKAGVEVTFEESFAAYEAESDTMLERWEAEQDALLELVRDAGLGYQLDDQKRLVIEGIDKDKVDKFQAKWNELRGDQHSEGEEYQRSLGSLNSEWKTFHNDVYALGSVLDREYDYGDLIAKKFWGGWADMTDGIANFLPGNMAASRRISERQAGQERLEQTYTYADAREEGIKGRYATMSMASQAANLTVAIGTSLIPGAQMWMAPALFGMSSGGQKRAELNQMMDAGEKATSALADLEKQFKAGSVSESVYINEKTKLEETIALGDLNAWQINGAVGMSAIIEGGISYYLGTVPNSRAAIKALTSVGDDVGKGIFRNNIKAGVDFLKATGKEMGGEVLEEELILLGDQLSTSLITGKDMDISWETLSETAIQSIMISGAMNGSSNAYNAIATQWTSRDSRAEYGKDSSRINDIRTALKNPTLDANARSTLLAESARITKKWGSEYASETEILSVLGGAGSLKTLIQNNIVRNGIYQKASIDVRDSQKTKDAKLETYLYGVKNEDGTRTGGLKPKERAQVESQLKSIENNIVDTQRKTEVKFNVDPLSKGGAVYQMYGEGGLEVAKEMATNNPEFNGLTNKEKTIAVHNEMKQKFDDQRMAETKQDKDAQRFVDTQVYGYQGGQKFTKGRDGKASTTVRTRRKKAAEESAYRSYMSMGTYVGSNALIMASEGNVSAKQVLSNEALKNTKFKEMGTTEKMIEYVTENAGALGFTANQLQDEVVGGRIVRKGVLSKIRDGNIKAFIGKNGKAIAIDAEGANKRLAKGDMLQATAVMHETFHAQDAVAMTDTEIKQMAIGMHADAQGNALLRRLSEKAIRHQVNNGLWDKSKRADQQSKEALDEYSKRFSEFIRHDEKAMKAARKYGQGLGNKFNEMAGKFASTKLGRKLGVDRSIGDFNFVDSKGRTISGAGMNYTMGFIDAFRKGEISLQTQRKIDAGGRLKDPSQVNDLAVKLSEQGDAEGAKQVRQSAKDASNQIQEAYKTIQQKIGDGTLDGGEFVQLASMFEQYVQGKINKFRNRPKFKELRDDIVGRILYEDNRGVMGLMQSYNENLNVPLAAYMFEQLAPKDRAGRIQEVVDAMLPETFDKRLDTEEGTTDIVDDSISPDDFDLQEEMRSTGVKIWERTGSAGLDIHKSIIADYLAGNIDTKGKNWKTLKTPQYIYNAVFEMMGIKPKPGNLTKGDIKNAQRWLDKHLGEFIAAVPKHHTTKMVKGKDGRLEARPDKAIGIPNVILEVMFNKGTRVDNLTPWHRKTNILDTEVLSIFGITERNNPNLYKKESNTSARIRSASKIIADAMYNQGVRVGMDINKDPLADIMAISDGKGKALFSEANVDMEAFAALSIDELQKQTFNLDKIAADVGWMTPEFYEKAYANNISNEVIDFADIMGNGDKFGGVARNFKKPLKGRIAKAKAKETQLLNLYFEKNAGTDIAIEQTKNAALELIRILPAEAIKAMGPGMFGLSGSNKGGGLGSVTPGTKNYRQEAADVKKAYDEKAKQADPANTEYADLAIMQGGKSPSPIFTKIQKILNKDIKADAKKALVDKEIGFDNIEKASAANKKALGLVLNAMSKVNPSARVGVMRMLEAQTNNGKSTRSLTGLKAIEYLDGPQALYSYKKKGETLYTDNVVVAKQKNVTEFGTNTKHPLYKAASAYADAYIKAQAKSSKSQWGPDKIKAEKKKKIQDLLRFKGEHIDPSANVHRGFAEALLDAWYNGGDLASATETLISGFDQSFGSKMLSDLQDDAFGTTSTLSDLRLAALKGSNRVKPSKWKNVLAKNNKLTPSQYDKVLSMINIDAMQDVRGEMGISQITTQLNADKQRVQEMRDKFVEQRKQEAAKMQDTELGKGADVNEAIKLKSDSRKATVGKAKLSESIIKVGKWNLDISTEQGKNIAAELADIKTVSSSEFKRVGRWNLDTSTKEGKSILAQLEKIPTVSSSETKGMTAWDFDDTLATTKSNVIFTKDGETKIISAEEFAAQGADLMAEGWVPDFSEFNKVTGGKPGPMFDEAMKRAKKYGTENTFILTARSSESAVAIKEFLDALGLNIPLENITGLANSTGEAKARWLLDKHAQGYNDIAFADDALQNVDAVRKAFNEFDIKGKIEQAKVKFSEEADANMQEMLDEGQQEIDDQFQEILEESKGVDRQKTFSAVKARQRGKNKGRFKIFLPPSAEDFKGLMYSFMGKGETGERHHKWIKERLFDPYSKGIRRLNSLQQEVSNDIRSLKKAIPGVKGKLKRNVGDTSFTNEQAVRVYNWVKAGVNVPGISQTDQQALVNAVESDLDLKIFAEKAQEISSKIGVDPNPGKAWLAGTVSSDLNDMMNSARGTLLGEFNGNADIIFSEKNLNKIEAVYGTNFREALEDSLYRMKTGSTRPFGQSRIMNNFMNWINGSVGTTMFFNSRSATLQMISNVNFMNWHDNNPIKAAGVFANQPQYWKDVAMIFNSDYLKQRRGGIGTDLNAAELLADMKDSSNPMKTFVAKLLQIGFTPTQIADSLAIATGGATMYRNRIKTYTKQGMSKTEAEAKAFEDMQEVAEETQQSARPDKISQQQASPLGKLILAFQNTPMQYNRIIKRSAQDWINGRGDPKEHASKIAYYGAVQSMIFYGLQTALFSSLFGDDDEEDLEKKQGRVLNGMMDSLLRGSGITGAVISTAKNTILKFIEQDAKNDDGEFFTDPNHAYTIIEALNLSPPIGIKARKLYSATQTWQFNRDVIDHMSKTDLDNPIYDATFSATEAVTNLPLSRLYSKYQNVQEAMNSDNETWQRVAMLLGWSRWSFGIKNQDVMSAKGEVKEIKAQEKEERKQQKKAEKEAETQAQNKAIIDEHIEEQEQQREDGVDESEITCAAISRSGNRCGKKILPGQSYCTIHEEVEQRADNKKVQCSHVKTTGDRCKMTTTNKSGKCYYHD